MSDDLLYPQQKKPLFVATPTESKAELDQAIASVQDADINQHFTQVFSYSGTVAAKLSVPGFAEGSATASEHCLIYDQAHWIEKEIGDYTYDIGWTQRLVIKIDDVKLSASVTVPSIVAASCSVGKGTASVQYVVRGLSGDAPELSGNVGKFDVDAFAEYQVKLAQLISKVKAGEIKVKPVVLARQKMRDPSATDRRDTYLGYAYRLAGISGILKGMTAQEWFTYMTTHGVDKAGKLQKIADEDYFKNCVEEAYGEYGLDNGQKLGDKPVPDQRLIRDTIEAELDGFEISRGQFVHAV